MAKKVKAIVNPELLRWSRESAGLQPGEVADKMGVSLDRFSEWESGNELLTMAQLRHLAEIYKRPIAIFYLSEKPLLFSPMKDFRRMPGEAPERESHELTMAIRRAHDRRSIALELLSDLGLAAPPFALSARENEKTELVGNRLREAAGVTLEEQSRWPTEHTALRAWRTSIESQGVLVFQATRVDPREMRGFSISDSPLPVIVINIADSLTGRIFSLLHEATHLMLRDGGVCDLHPRRSAASGTTEVFCNAVAAAALVPADALKGEAARLGHRSESEWTDYEVLSLGRRFRVSREVIARRLVTTRLAPESFYRAKRAAFLKEYETREAPRKDGFAPPDVMALATAGRPFTSLVLDSYYQEKITSSDVAEFLGVGLQHLGKIEKGINSPNRELQPTR